MDYVKEISKRRFESLCYVRDQNLQLIGKEVAWFEAICGKLLAVVVFDYTDKDYNCIILGRDRKKLFRCIDIIHSIKDLEEAKEKLNIHIIKKYLNDGNRYYSQEDEKSSPNELFDIKIDREKAHPYFLLLKEKPSYEAARNLIQEIAYHFVDVDGNYIQQFQGDGFHARLWELFLHAYLNHSQFRINSNYKTPDFCISMYGNDFFIEAVTVNPSRKEGFDITGKVTGRDIRDLSFNYLPIKFYKTLSKKIKKKYWELPHVKGHPFLFAIHDYHIPSGPSFGSMCWSRDGLYNYLYGIGIDENGNQIEVDTCTFNGETRPSNFFGNELHKDVSAILFSNGAVLSTFNRMGKIADLGSKDVKIFRYIFKWDPMKNEIIPSVVDIDSKDYEESWSDTVIMYHNPKAKIPIDPNFFLDITHVFFDLESKNFTIIHNPNEIFTSRTFTFHK